MEKRNGRQWDPEEAKESIENTKLAAITPEREAKIWLRDCSLQRKLKKRMQKHLMKEGAFDVWQKITKDLSAESRSGALNAGNWGITLVGAF